MSLSPASDKSATLDESDYQARLKVECELSIRNLQTHLDTTKKGQGEIIARMLDDEVPSGYEEGLELEDYHSMWAEELEVSQKREASLRRSMMLVASAAALDLPEVSRYTNAIVRQLRSSPRSLSASSVPVVRVYLLNGAAERFAAAFPCSQYGAESRHVDLNLGGEEEVWVTLSIRSMSPHLQLVDMEELLVIPEGSPVKLFVVPPELADTEEVATVYTKARNAGFTRQAAVAAVAGALGRSAFEGQLPRLVKSRPATSRRMGMA